MKLVYKVLLANILVSAFVAFIFGLSQRPIDGSDFLMMFGLTCLGVALIDLLISVILFIAGKEHQEWAQGFLLSCGVLLLLGFATCTGALKGINFR